MDMDCDPCSGGATFEIGPPGVWRLAYQRCDGCGRFETDADAVESLWRAIEDLLRPAIGDDVDGALRVIVDALRRDSATDAGRIADCFEAFQQARSGSAERDED